MRMEATLRGREKDPKKGPKRKLRPSDPKWAGGPTGSTHLPPPGVRLMEATVRDWEGWGKRLPTLEELQGGLRDLEVFGCESKGGIGDHGTHLTHFCANPLTLSRT